MKVLNSKKIYDAHLPVEILTQVRAWFHEAMNGNWDSIVNLKSLYPNCKECGSTIQFPIASNTYLIVTRVNFSCKVVLILELRENDK